MRYLLFKLLILSVYSVSITPPIPLQKGQKILLDPAGTAPFDHKMATDFKS